ncbi:MAG: mechanosensitive ion channel family protein [Gammaproteobacteria bacterium]|nr:mechanosensitive ion channel family protein [Gammaproteobacteria bacterium]
MAAALLAKLPILGLAILVIVVTWIAARIINAISRRMMERSGLRESLVALFCKLINIGVWVAGILVAAMTIFPSFTPGQIVTTLGLSSIAIGFAFKDIFENFIAGILVLAREPFRLGDFIECDGIEGTVEHITIRDTHIRQPNANRVVLPNAMLFKNPVTVFTDVKTRRITVMAGVGYGEDMAKARDVISEAVSNAETVNTDKPIQIYAKEFGDSSVNFEVTWWTGTDADPANIRVSRDKVMEAVKKALDDAGIEIPFPYRTLTFSEPLTISDAREQKD